MERLEIIEKDNDFESEEIERHSVKLIIFGLIFSVFSILVFGLIAEDILDQEIMRMDTYIVDWIHSYNTPLLDSIMFWVTQIGSFNLIFSFSLFIIYWLYKYKKDNISILFFIVTVGGGGILNSVLKIAFKRARPSVDSLFDALGYSFPSGHSMGAMIFYGFIGYLIIKSQSRTKFTKTISTFLLTVFILIIGISRVYLNAHFPSDVIAGYSVGFIWLTVCIFTLNLTKKRYRKKSLLNQKG